MSEDSGRAAGWRARLLADRPTLADEPLAHLHGAVISLAAVSGLFHLVEGIQLVVYSVGMGFTVYLGASLVFAGVGFLAGAALAAVGVLRRYLYLFGIPFTAGQVVAWYVLNRPIGESDTLGIVDKIVQLSMIAGLVVIVRRG